MLRVQGSESKLAECRGAINSGERKCEGTEQNFLHSTSKQEQKAVVSLEQPARVGLAMVDDPSSPLKSFEMKWTLKDVSPDKCHVQLEVSYDFKSSLHKMLAGPIFQSIQTSIVPEFEKRCKKVLQKE